MVDSKEPSKPNTSGTPLITIGRTYIRHMFSIFQVHLTAKWYRLQPFSFKEHQSDISLAHSLLLARNSLSHTHAQMCLASADKFRLTFILVSLCQSLSLLSNSLQLLANFQTPYIFWMRGFFKGCLCPPSTFKKLYHSLILATLVSWCSDCWVRHKKYRATLQGSA